MLKRKLAKTGRDISIIGIGGFHLVETPLEDTARIINSYLDAGGNYIETAAQYGEGISEIKIGRTASARRSEFMLATKIIARDKKGALESFSRSLRNLKTDYVDILFLHEPLAKDDFEKTFSKNGALEAAIELKEKGFAKLIGISGHGYPKPLIEAFDLYDFGALLVNINYFDNFNFPEIEKALLPKARKAGAAVFAMKALADGLLIENTESAIRYTLSKDIDCLVLGINRLDYLKLDLRIADSFSPLKNSEYEELVKTDKILGSYICRQCGKCLPCPEGIDIPKIFEIEGIYDRQLYDGEIRKPQDHCYRELLRFWFANKEIAKEKYIALEIKADACSQCGECLEKCEYKIDIIRKLKICESKLSIDKEAVF